MCLHVSQCFYCVKTETSHKTRFLREIPRFSAFNVIVAKNTFKHKKKLVVALVTLLLHNSMRSHASQCFQCVITDNVHEKRS